jgi:hypothetical protein
VQNVFGVASAGAGSASGLDRFRPPPGHAGHAAVFNPGCRRHEAISEDRTLSPHIWMKEPAACACS